ncbi:leader peptidase [Vibrio astriarenae]|nr:leader peptidase [Vibrio sp. C7]
MIILLSSVVGLIFGIIQLRLQKQGIEKASHLAISCYRWLGGDAVGRANLVCLLGLRFRINLCRLLLD